MTVLKTPNLGLPVPQGNELVIGGDDAIERLGNAVDTINVNAYLVMASTGPLGIDGALTIPLGKTAGSAHFTDGGDLITYTGPDRWFLIAADISCSTTGLGAGGPWQFSTALEHAGTHLTGSGLINPDVSNAQSHTFNLCTPVLLGNGQTIGLKATSTRQGDLYASLRIAPLAPAYGVADL